MNAPKSAEDPQRLDPAERNITEGSGGGDKPRFEGSHPRRRPSTKGVDPEDRSLVEPDRNVPSRMSSDEAEARKAAHTDRDPTDDIHQANQGAQH